MKVEKKYFLRLVLIIFLIVAFEIYPQTTHNNQQTTEGCKFQIKNGLIFLPSSFDFKQDKLNLFVHLHGSPSAAIEIFSKSKINGVFIALHIGSLSSPYRIAFSDQNFPQKIIDTSFQILRDSIPSFDFIDYDYLCITSFSAGYGGVREILKNEKYYKRINAIILADGLHTDYIEEDNCKMPNSDQMKDFLQFAKDAVNQRKEFLITHSEIYPGNYSSTTETADYLLTSTNTERVFAERYFGNDLTQKSYAFNGGFQVFGFHGNTGADHMKHFYNLRQFLLMLNFK